VSKTPFHGNATRRYGRGVSDDGTDPPIDERELAADLGDVLASHARLVEHLGAIDPVAPTTPSLLPDWTVGHVLTHLARNADSQLSMLRGDPQYPHGREGRDADIEDGSTRSWDELLDDLEQTCASVDEAFRACVDWNGNVDTIAAARPKVMLPFLRQREVEVHHADLGLGYTFADFPARYLRKELRLMEMQWRARKPMGLTPLPEAALALPPPTRLAWLMGRVEIDPLPPAHLL
jgi:maleylpyruvate isomerase